MKKEKGFICLIMGVYFLFALINPASVSAQEEKKITFPHVIKVGDHSIGGTGLRFTDADKTAVTGWGNKGVNGIRLPWGLPPGVYNISACFSGEYKEMVMLIYFNNFKWRLEGKHSGAGFAKYENVDLGYVETDSEEETFFFSLNTKKWKKGDLFYLESLTFTPVEEGKPYVLALKERRVKEKVTFIQKILGDTARERPGRTALILIGGVIGLIILIFLTVIYIQNLKRDYNYDFFGITGILTIFVVSVYRFIGYLLYKVTAGWGFFSTMDPFGNRLDETIPLTIKTLVLASPLLVIFLIVSILHFKKPLHAILTTIIMTVTVAIAGYLGMILAAILILIATMMFFTFLMKVTGKTIGDDIRAGSNASSASRGDRYVCEKCGKWVVCGDLHEC